MPDGMKMVMIVYNEAIDAEVMEALGACGLKNYTKIKGVFGSGVASGTHLGDDIWPGINNILYVACLEKEAVALTEEVRRLRGPLGAEGVKSFQWTLESVV
jgi:hypothetical protein